MPTYSVDINVRKKIFEIPVDPVIAYNLPSSNASLTNASINAIAETISTKPQLITRAELQNLGNNINLVGVDPLANLITNSNKTFSPKLLNWVEPYDVDGNGTYKTIFYTEVNSELKVGDKVYILNGNYDSDLLIKKNKYKKGRDGYKVLFVDKCKIALDIDYTGVQPYKLSNDDDFINVYYVRNSSEFLHANRAVSTKNGQFQNKFSYLNNIIYVDSSYSTSQDWGINSGVTGSGFYFRSSTASWINITNDIITTGSYSYATQSLGLKVMNGVFTYNGREYRENFIYKWFVGPTQSEWITDVTYYAPYIGKSNFRGGSFNGKWNSGIFGQYSNKINWEGNGSTWNVGTLINTNWKKGILDSLYTASQSYFASFDNFGLPYQKANSPNNAGRGYNFVLDSTMNKSTIVNGSIYSTIFGQIGSTYSVVENEILGYDTTYANTIKSAFFNYCEFNNSDIQNAELKNTRANNSKFERVKSINSYFNNSVLKDSSYNSDNIIKVLAYDELTASESSNTLGLTYSTFGDVVQKVYKFYINKSGYDRLKLGDTFYLKGIKINDNKKNVINFFDKKLKIGSWTEYTEENAGITTSGKRGYQYSVFLSTPSDNTYKFASATFSSSGIKYKTIPYMLNPNSQYYSIDLWVSRYDVNSTIGGENLNFNTDTTSYDVSLLQGPNSLGNVVDVTSAYIVDADFDSGLMENSDWNSGSHIEDNNDNNITIPSLSGGTYNLSIDNSGYIVATTSYNFNQVESKLINVGDVVFLDSVDFNWGTVSRLPDAYKVISNSNGVYQLKEVGTASTIISLSASNGYYYTQGAENRYGHIKKLKISKSNIKSGFLRRSYLEGSLIQNLELNYLDKDFSNLENIRGLVVSDSIFSDNGNILSNATYENSFFLNNGSDVWNSGIIQNSVWANGTFSNGVIRDSRWINGTFLNGWFYNSRTFNGTSSATSPYYYSENINSYYKSGTLPNNRNSWQDGLFINGDFYKSDWEFGTFSNGRFYYSNFYNGNVIGGVLGSNQLSTSDTRIYNGTVSYAIVDNATLYAIDTSYGASVSQNIAWLNGNFNNGLFGSDISQGLSHSAIWYNGSFFGGQFISMAKWKNGTFNGGKFLSGYGWTQSNSASQSNYGWENGVFKGGEFGNANGLTNSTWYTGEFDGGVFKGRVWNNGVFSYGELQGSGTSSPVGGVTCSNAKSFVDGYTYSYWGLWRDGLFTNTKDRFIKDQKFFTTLSRAINRELSNRPPKTAKFKNGLWLSGTFSHPNGEMNNSVWLDGAFERGNFFNSSFNPYVERSQLGLTSSIIVQSELLYSGNFTQSSAWITSTSSVGGGATFSAAYTSTLAYYVSGASSSGLYLYNSVTNLPSGHYQIDMKIATYSSNARLQLNLGSSSVFDSYTPLTIGTNSFRGRTNGGSVSLYADTNGVDGYVGVDNISIKQILPTFNLDDDSCYWDNGYLNQSDFYISQWKNGTFNLGTASGMIWKNGTANYMNAFNVFWESGDWRNGNWYGSSFEYDGELTEDYALQILYRGMSWSGTSSVHAWNIFLDTNDQENGIAYATASSVGYVNIVTSGWSSGYYDNTIAVAYMPPGAPF
jgi:hypothetical protein